MAPPPNSQSMHPLPPAWQLPCLHPQFPNRCALALPSLPFTPSPFWPFLPLHGPGSGCPLCLQSFWASHLAMVVPTLPSLLLCL